MIKERIEALRREMSQWGWDVAITVGEDPHNSEYTPSRWSQRQFISGFTGSAGVVTVTKDHAGLWTDSRYWIQAEKELQGSGIGLHRMVSVEDCDWMHWIAENIPQGGTVGVDGLCFSMGNASALKKMLKAKDARLVSKPDFLEALWSDRPGLPEEPVWIHHDCFAGRSSKDKIGWLRKTLAEKGCTHMFISCLDQIAWLLNIRSADIEYCPMVISFALVGPERIELFALESKFCPEIRSQLETDGIFLHPYSDVGGFIAGYRAEGRILIDADSLNYETGQALEQAFGIESMVNEQSPIDLEKSIKNQVEIEGFRKAYIQDGIAQTRFFMWLEQEVSAGRRITESDASDHLHELRAMNPDFIDESFETISAYGTNAAIVHYSTVRGRDAVIEPHGLYMNDSGAHYSYGTTDITRTMPMGPLTALEREDYTIDLMAMIELGMAIFPAGTPGGRLDAVARRPLWQAMRNFGHGTGHGVGNVLSVHEGPQTIRQNLKPQPLVPGMITSDEPGIYREGFHGVRHENMILCRQEAENEFGTWLSFETLTRTYIDTAPLLTDMMSPQQIQWLNDFNATVYRDISPYLTAVEAKWLEGKTRAVQRQ